MYGRTIDSKYEFSAEYAGLLLIKYVAKIFLSVFKSVWYKIVAYKTVCYYSSYTVVMC